MRKQTIAELYRVYQKRLKDADAMDFDDMIVKTVELLRENPDVHDYYKANFAMLWWMNTRIQTTRSMSL